MSLNHRLVIRLTYLVGRALAEILMSRYKMFHVPFNQIHYILAILNLSLLKKN